MDRGAWQATVHWVTKSWTQLSVCAHTHTHTHRRSIPYRIPVIDTDGRGRAGDLCPSPCDFPQTMQQEILLFCIQSLPLLSGKHY